MKKLLVSFILFYSFTASSQSLDTVIVKNLQKGWNLVGFMGQTSEQTKEAFASIIDKVEIIKTLDGFYSPEVEEYLNSLPNVEPLDGVLIKVSENCVLERIVKKSAILYYDNEKDPIYLQSPAAEISEEDIEKWNSSITAEVDGSITNEIQDLSLNGNILTITNTSNASEIDLSKYMDNTDTQLTEKQVDEMTANNGFLTAEIDGSITNEIQTLNEVLTEGNNAEGKNILNTGKITIGEETPKASAALEINTSNGALLLPRLSTFQRDALSPVPGMMIYNTNENKFQGYVHINKSGTIFENPNKDSYRWVLGERYDYFWTGPRFNESADITIESFTFYVDELTEAGDVDIVVVKFSSYFSCDTTIIEKITVTISSTGENTVVFPSPVFCKGGDDYAILIDITGYSTAFWLEAMIGDPEPKTWHAYLYGTSRCNHSGSDLKFTISGSFSGNEWVDLH